MGAEFQFGKMKLSYGDDGGDGCLAMWMYLMSLNCVFKMVKMRNFMLCTLHPSLILENKDCKKAK